MMKTLVAVKRVVDPYVKIRVKPDNTGVETGQVKMVMNPFDEIALEAALRLREAGHTNEVILVTIGSTDAQETLRHGLALGADRAIHIVTDNVLCSLNIAKILQHIVKQEEPSLVLMGKQTIDGDNNQTPQMLAGLLDWPQAVFASTIVLEDNQWIITREIDGGLETLRLTLPAVISVDLRLNVPRYATLPNIMKAKQKPLKAIPLDSLDLMLTAHIEVLSVNTPPERSGGSRVHSVEELVDKLRHVAQVIE